MKEFLEAGKKRLAGDTARAATTDEVKVLRRGTRDLKEVVAEQALEHSSVASLKHRAAPRVPGAEALRLSARCGEVPVKSTASRFDLMDAF